MNQEQRNAAVASAVKFYEQWMADPTNDGRAWGTRHTLADFAIQYAAEQVAAERTRIVDELESICNWDADAVDVHAVKEYIEQLRGADTESDNTSDAQER